MNSRESEPSPLEGKDLQAEAGRGSPARAACRIYHRVAVATLLALFLSSPASAATIVTDCSSGADDFCGPLDDPCVVSDPVVVTASPCTPNFGARTFRNEAKITLPNDATFTVTAGKIEVEGKISGKHIKQGDGDGADVSLIATGDVSNTKKIDVSGRDTPGSITIDAGGNVSIGHQLIARSKGGTSPAASGGTISIDADGTVSSTKRGKIVVRGKKKVTAAGVATISGDLGVNLLGRIEARGLVGGSVSATTATGSLTLEEEIRAYGEFSSGGTVDLSAPSGTLTITGKKGAIRAKGGAPGGGGSIVLSAVTIDALRNLNAHGIGTGAGGSVVVTGESVSLRRLRVDGRTDGGTIDVTSTTGTVDIDGRVNADSKTGAAGSIDVNAATDATVDGPISANGMTSGGEARIIANGNLDLGQNDKVKIEADGETLMGGVIEGVSNTGNLTAMGRFSAETGGCIRLDAPLGTVTTGSKSTFSPTPQTAPCP